MEDREGDDPVARVRAERADGWADEVAFWDHWLMTKGFNWPDDYRRKTDPDARVIVPRRYLPARARRPWRFLPGRRARVSVLDVGAGPLSLVGRRLPGVEVELVAVDPLAAEYDALLAKHGIEPATRTRACPAEAVADVLGDARFDVVYCQNALDHSANPMAGLEQMLRTVRPGGWVVLKHTIDEAETESYGSLHDWNFRIEDGRFVIWNREQRFHPDEQLALAGEVEAKQVLDEGYEWVLVGLRRRSA